MRIFKRIDELEIENERLKLIINAMENQFGSIIEKATTLKQQNRYNSNYGFETIKELAEEGLDIRFEIKKEQVDDV